MGKLIGGLDLGQTQDPSALVIVDRSTIPDRDRPGFTQNRFDVRHIHRWPLGTKYPDIVSDLKDWYGRPELRDTTLVIDETGVGRPVVDFVRRSGIPASIKPLSITGGLKPGDGTVPKKDLIGAVIAALQTQRLKFARAMPFREELEKELETFRVKVTIDRNETFAAWREKDTDDIVLALALAVWWGERGKGMAAAPEPNSRQPDCHTLLEEEQRRIGFDMRGLPPGLLDYGWLPPG